MKKIKILWFVSLSLVLLLTTFNAWALWKSLRVDEISFPSVGTAAINLFNGNANDGSLVMNGKVPEQRTAIDFWPINGKLPALHALTETAWYATRFKDWPTFERFSISQMGSGKQIRFGVERGGTGQFRELIFCFEDVAPGEADCKLLIKRDGVFVRHNSTWLQIGE